MKKILKLWMLPVLISLGIFLMVRPVFAQLVEKNLSDTGDIQVSSEIGENGFRQIYYLRGGEKYFVSSREYTSGEPNQEGDYITWMGQNSGGTWQIFLYNIPTGITTQLTSSGNNANPMVDNGRVTWEGWVNDGWQVFFFDGVTVTQLTSGDPSLNPMIEGDNIIYARRDATGQWRSVLYSISEKKAFEVSFGNSSKHPRLVNGEIFLGEGGEKFALTAQDLFLLDLSSLSDEPEEVTEAEIVEELVATQAGVVEEPIISLTPAPTPSDLP